MPLFAIIGFDVADSQEKRSQTRPAHLERLTALDAQNRLILAGPTPIAHGDTAMSGSLVVADFDDIEQAQHWASNDPYLIAGVYSHVEIKPFLQVFPKS